jgi:integral membrane sensor domain MASE1
MTTPVNGWRIGRQLARFAFFEIAFLIAYRFGMSFSQQFAAPFWFPDSVLLTALLLSERRSWWLYVLGALPIRLFLLVDPTLGFFLHVSQMIH